MLKGLRAWARSYHSGSAFLVRALPVAIMFTTGRREFERASALPASANLVAIRRDSAILRFSLIAIATCHVLILVNGGVEGLRLGFLHPVLLQSRRDAGTRGDNY